MSESIKKRREHLTSTLKSLECAIYTAGKYLEKVALDGDGKRVGLFSSTIASIGYACADIRRELDDGYNALPAENGAIGHSMLEGLQASGRKLERP